MYVSPFLTPLNKKAFENVIGCIFKLVICKMHLIWFCPKFWCLIKILETLSVRNICTKPLSTFFEKHNQMQSRSSSLD